MHVVTIRTVQCFIQCIVNHNNVQRMWTVKMWNKFNDFTPQHSFVQRSCIGTFACFSLLSWLIYFFVTSTVDRFPLIFSLLRRNTIRYYGTSTSFYAEGISLTLGRFFLALYGSFPDGVKSIINTSATLMPGFHHSGNAILPLPFLPVAAMAIDKVAPKKIESKKTWTCVFRQTIRRALVMFRFVIHWLRELLSFGLPRSMVTLE